MIKNKNHLIILISWISVFLWMLTIFNLSSQVADQSDRLSKGIVAIIVEILEKITHGYNIDISGFNHLLRKFAHFSAYLVLGVLVMNALRRNGVKGARAFVFALGICFFYAVSDEIHQLFVPGRSGQVRDVLIDSTGAAVGIGVQMLFKRLKTNKMYGNNPLGI